MSKTETEETTSAITTSIVKTESKKRSAPPPDVTVNAEYLELLKPRKAALSFEDVQYAITAYFVLPLLVVWITSKLHESLTLDGDTSANTTKTATINFLLSSKVLLLGFSSAQTLWSTIYERVISVVCWGLTFLFVRKGWNPETRQHNVQTRWKGTVLSTLMVFYSTFGRIVFQQNSTLFRQYRSPFWEAVLVGVSWGLSSILIRRRLDPALRKNLLQRCWKDAICGSLSLGMGSFLKSQQYTADFFLSMENYLQESFPLLQGNNSMVTNATYILFDISPSNFWHVFINACEISILWGVPYLFIRRGCNPDIRRHFLTKYGRDALYGSLALFVYVYLKSAVKKWLPVLVQMLVWWKWGSLSYSSWAIFNGDGDVSSLGDEL